MPQVPIEAGATMAPKREDHLKENEEHAKRSLEHMGRRWPTNPNVYYVLPAVVLIVVLFPAF